MRQTLRSGGGEAAAGELPRIASGRSKHRRPYEDAEQPRTKFGHAEQTRASELDHRRPTGLAPTPAQSSNFITPSIHEAETGARVRPVDKGHKSNPAAAGRPTSDCFAALAMTGFAAPASSCSFVFNRFTTKDRKQHEGRPTQAISNRPAAPMPPPTHIVTTT